LEIDSNEAVSFDSEDGFDEDTTAASDNCCVFGSQDKILLTTSFGFS
jgi:hypothetical protein